MAAPSTSAAATASHDLRRRAWRWHFIAAALVIPFVLWQSATGTLYLWAEHWVDLRHAGLRFVAPGEHMQPLDRQLEAARALQPGRRVDAIHVAADPGRSTQFMFTDARGLPMAVWVDPYRAQPLGSLAGSAWPVGWSRSLHGGWPLGVVGSALLEIGACWTLAMVFTGLYLWWPRDGRGWRALLPRWRSAGRQRWRELHACVAVWFSLLIVVFLLTALPWTQVWGGQLLQPAQRLLQLDAPRAAGFAPVFAGQVEEARSPRRLQTVVEQARAQGMRGDLVLRMVDGPPGAAVSVRERRPRLDRSPYLLMDPGSGALLERAEWEQFPWLAKWVARGVQFHEGAYLGRIGPWINTLFALSLLWLSVTGAMLWWRRRPAGGLGVPPAPGAPWPWGLRIGVVLAGLALPLLAVSMLCLWSLERLWSLIGRR